MKTNEAKSNEEEIRGIIDSWADAIRNLNMEGILASHTDDILMFDVPLPVQNKGMAEYKATWDLFFKYFNKGSIWDLREVNINAGDSIAYATIIIRCGDTEEKGFDVRLTMGFKKINGAWKIAHEHHSVPAKE